MPDELDWLSQGMPVCISTLLHHSSFEQARLLCPTTGSNHQSDVHVAIGQLGQRRFRSRCELHRGTEAVARTMLRSGCKQQRETESASRT